WFPVEAEWRQPQPQVQPLVDRLAHLLEGKVLAAPLEKERTDRGVPVTPAEGERPHRPPAGPEGNRLRLVPGRAEPAEDGVEVADDDQVERVALAGAAAVRRRPRQRGEAVAQPGLVAGDRVAGRDGRVEFLAVVIGAQAGNPQREQVLPFAARPEQFDPHLLVALVEVGEHEPLRGFAGVDSYPADAVRLEEG